MEVQFTKEIQAKLDQLSSETGQSADALIQDAMAGYFNELAEVRSTLARRYNEIVTGSIKLVPGEAVAARLREKSAAARQRQTA